MRRKSRARFDVKRNYKMAARKERLNKIAEKFELDMIYAFGSQAKEVPEWVKKEVLDLIVEVSFSVTPEGHTISLRVERSSGYTDVDASVLDSVRKLRFNPVRESRDVRGTVSYFISTK